MGMPEDTTDICQSCGRIVQIGDYPFCPHGKTGVGVIADDVPGGFTVENGFDQPTTFYSHSAHRKALAERGLEIKVRWAGPHDQHVSRWDAVDAYTLAAAKSLVERSAR